MADVTLNNGAMTVYVCGELIKEIGPHLDQVWIDEATEYVQDMVNHLESAHDYTRVEALMDIMAKLCTSWDEHLVPKQ